jgi:hypothetical protein
MDSYHIWILLAPTRTYNAFRFIRQINAEAKVDCECWPKQKSLKDKNGKYGNLVKLPICFHQKSRGRSAFLDPETFEPLEGEISHPGLVHLLEVPDLDELKAELNGIPSAKSLLKASAPPHTVVSGTTLDYCMQGILDARTLLEGAAGHSLRLAIAIKAQNIGLDAETTVNLFKHQEDFDHDYSLNKVLETWSYSYNNWSCKKLLDQCGTLVRPYCSTCPYCPKLSSGAEAETA